MVNMGRESAKETVLGFGKIQISDTSNKFLYREGIGMPRISRI